MRKRTNRRVLVDFDGVLRAKDKQGLPIEGARASIRALRKLGFEIVVFTTRAAPSEAGNVHGSIKVVENWLAENDIDYDSITGEKLQADYYIDDKAIAFTSWPDALGRIT